MSLIDRAKSAYGAFVSSGRKVDAVRLKAPPAAPVGPVGNRVADVVASVNVPPAARHRPRRRRVAPLPVDRSRWLRADIEAAEHQANSGDLRRAAQIAQWVKEDLVCGGLMLTRCSVPRLPREWRGDDEARVWLQGEGSVPGCFDRIHPPGELEEMAIDHLDLGAGVAIYVQPEGQPYPRLTRLDNQFLRYLPSEDRWQYQGWGQVYDVTPGDGVWVLHTNGLVDPWRRGIWSALGYDQVSEDGAGLARDGFIWKFGTPFVVAKAPTGAAEEQKASFWEGTLNFVMGFAGVTPGYDIELIQPEATGREVFTDAEARVERRAMIRIAGQVVTVTGGVGFANAEIFATIASHLVARTGQDLATCLNEQCLPSVLEWSERAGHLSPSCGRSLLLAYDTMPPQARQAEANAMKAAAEAVTALEAAGFAVDRSEMQARFRLPGKPLEVRLPAVPVPQLPEPATPNDAKADADAGPPPIDYAADLARSMNEHVPPVEQCRHGFKNSCPRCGIRREDVLVPGADGQPHGWRVQWRPIAGGAS